MKKLNEGAINKIRGYMDTSYTMAEEDFESLYSKIRAGKVELNQSVITAKEGSKYIESIYMGYPLPAVTIAEYNGILKIIDGRKFVTAVIRFMEGKYELIGLRELKELNGCNYAELKCLWYFFCLIIKRQSVKKSSKKIVKMAVVTPYWAVL